MTPPANPYLRDRRRKDYNFVQLAHSLHEFVYTRSLNNINIMIIALDLHGNRKIRLMKNLESKKG